jgi:hypothetical protein
LTTFIDHRRREMSNAEFRMRIIHSTFPIHHSTFPFTGRVRRNNGSIAKKVLDDIPLTERQPWGSRLCRGEHRGVPILRTKSAHRDITLNLTYSLVKEPGYLSFRQTNKSHNFTTGSRQTRVSVFPNFKSEISSLRSHLCRDQTHSSLATRC